MLKDEIAQLKYSLSLLVSLFIDVFLQACKHTSYCKSSSKSLIYLVGERNTSKRKSLLVPNMQQEVDTDYRLSNTLSDNFKLFNITSSEDGPGLRLARAALSSNPYRFGAGNQSLGPRLNYALSLLLLIFLESCLNHGK